MTADLPRHADTLILGGGTAGAAIAGLLAEQTDDSILVLEAGPDYGPLADGQWPEDLLDARDLPESHDWGYASGDRFPGRIITFARARVIGGCSAHNGCAAIWGSRLDYDGWAALGNPGWSSDDLLPLFRSASRRLRVRQPALEEIQPFHRAFLDVAPAVGIPLVDDLNDLDQDIGMAPSPVNIDQGIRWNTAFAYLDPVRDRPNLTIRGNMLIDRVVIERGRATGAIVIGPNGPAHITAGRVVVSAGTYGTPAILLRSGIGDPDELRGLGIAPTHALPGVGRNLHDHPSVELAYRGTQKLIDRIATFAKNHWLPEEQTIAKARSSSCNRGFDIHLYPVGSPYGQQKTRWEFAIPVACMTPRSRGRLRLTGTDPDRAPLLDHGYLTDPDGADRRVLIDAVKLARAFAAQPALTALLGDELKPGPEVRSNREIATWIDQVIAHYYHPVGTCKMGPVTDPEAVVDTTGKVYGLDALYVADCSLIPIIPRANTNVPAVVVAERIARGLIDESGVKGRGSEALA